MARPPRSEEKRQSLALCHEKPCTLTLHPSFLPTHWHNQDFLSTEAISRESVFVHSARRAFNHAGKALSASQHMA